MLQGKIIRTNTGHDTYTTYLVGFFIWSPTYLYIKLDY